jgi:hypothetical protein
VSVTAEEQAAIDAVPWPYRLGVARRFDAAREERASQARAAEDVRRHEETLAYAAHTRRRADEETRKHAAGQPCERMFCGYDEH